MKVYSSDFILRNRFAIIAPEMLCQTLKMASGTVAMARFEAIHVTLS